MALVVQRISGVKWTVDVRAKPCPLSTVNCQLCTPIQAHNERSGLTAAQMGETMRDQCPQPPRTPGPDRGRSKRKVRGSSARCSTTWTTIALRRRGRSGVAALPDEAVVVPRGAHRHQASGLVPAPGIASPRKTTAAVQMRTQEGGCEMKAIVVTDEAAGTAGMTLAER